MLTRRDTLEMFRTRLVQLIDDSGLNRTAFADSVGIDRSTLSQLLSAANRRLPRVDTLVALATSGQVSIDWLLGLTHEGRVRTDIVREATAIEPGGFGNDEGLIAWLRDAIGLKIRYVPATVPDLLKTEAVIVYEAGPYLSRTPERELDSVAEQMAWQQRPETDMECCTSIQGVKGFARGEGIWRDLSPASRLAQLDQMIERVDELYPTFRWFLYDGRQRFAAPVTIFGVQRAALYIGHVFVVLNAPEQVRALVRNFDDLIRSAVVQPPDVTQLLRRLRDEIAAEA
ncbi:MAG: helix-turn-helix domain-containing protein [Acidimicrobiales bacterium]